MTTHENRRPLRGDGDPSTEKLTTHPTDLTTLSDVELQALGAERLEAFLDATSTIDGHRADYTGLNAVAANTDGYEAGLPTGYMRGMADQWPVALEVGRRRGWREATARWDAEHSAFLDASNRGLVRDVAGAPSYAELCERRGEYDRAERARRTLRERGVA